MESEEDGRLGRASWERLLMFAIAWASETQNGIAGRAARDLSLAAKTVATTAISPIFQPYQQNSARYGWAMLQQSYNCGRRVPASQHRRCSCSLTGGRPGGPKDETATAVVCPPLVTGTVRPHCPALLQCSTRPLTTLTDGLTSPYFACVWVNGKLASQTHLRLLLEVKCGCVAIRIS